MKIIRRIYVTEDNVIKLRIQLTDVSWNIALANLLPLCDASSSIRTAITWRWCKWCHQCNNLDNRMSSVIHLVLGDFCSLKWGWCLEHCFLKCCLTSWRGSTKVNWLMLAWWLNWFPSSLQSPVPNCLHGCQLHPCSSSGKFYLLILTPAKLDNVRCLSSFQPVKFVVWCDFYRAVGESAERGLFWFRRVGGEGRAVCWFWRQRGCKALCGVVW